MQFVTEPGCTVPVAGEYDVVVLGGGPAGIAAAADAARTAAALALRARVAPRAGRRAASGTIGAGCDVA
jgi:pyruvate/2-oxoglutarate dehydrogenase complex dihydrolipoamide dehydrogenase (E3) component